MGNKAIDILTRERVLLLMEGTYSSGHRLSLRDCVRTSIDGSKLRTFRILHRLHKEGLVEVAYEHNKWSSFWTWVGYDKFRLTDSGRTALISLRSA